MSLFNNAINLVSTLFLYLRIALHRVLLFISQTIEYRTTPVKKEFHRTVLLLGDGTAEGIGDSFGHTGLCSRLNALIRKEREQSGLRMVWSVLTFGRIFSYAADWLPVSEQRTTLFHRAVKKSMFMDACVVVLLFGMHDDINDAQLPNHIADIARAVALLGKHVVVATLPNFYSHKDERYAKVTAANQKLKRLIKEVAEQVKPSRISVTCEVDTSKTTCMGAHTSSEYNGFFMLNGNGYRLFSRDVYEELVLAAKRVEWSYWKDKIAM